jgi:hypothetical protein
VSTGTLSFTNPDGSQAAVTVNYEYIDAPPVPPVVVPQPTMFGDTPINKSDAAGVAESDKMYGIGAVIRLYCQTVLLPNFLTDRAVIGSFKSMTGITSALLAGYWRVAFFHEIDHQIIAKAITLAQWRIYMTQLVEMGTPNLMIILTADCLTNPDKNPNDYLIPGVKYLGIDFDGVSPSATSTSYHDYTVALARAVAFAKANNMILSCPELNAYRGAFDPDGSIRAQWTTNNASAMQDAGFEAVCVWNQKSAPASVYDKPAETSMMRNMLALGARLLKGN